MKVLPQVTIPLQGIGAPRPQVGGSNDDAGLVAESLAVACKVHRKGLGHSSQANSQLSSGAGAEAPSKDISCDSAIRNARGKRGNLHELKLRGARKHALRWGSHMPKEEVEK